MFLTKYVVTVSPIGNRFSGTQTKQTLVRFQKDSPRMQRKESGKKSGQSVTSTAIRRSTKQPYSSCPSRSFPAFAEFRNLRVRSYHSFIERQFTYMTGDTGTKWVSAFFVNSIEVKPKNLIRTWRTIKWRSHLQFRHFCARFGKVGHSHPLCFGESWTWRFKFHFARYQR